jgi:hypothetical protein
MSHIIASSILAISTIFIAVEPPLFPIAHVDDRAIRILDQHMIYAPEITVEDYKVYQQLYVDHLKYEMIGELMHQLARNAKPGEHVEASRLGKFFEDIDSNLDKALEKMMQENMKESLERQREEIDKKIKEIGEPKKKPSLAPGKDV